MQERRRGDRKHRLMGILALTCGLYVSLFVWPTPWRYDRIGRNPVRTNRVTGEVEILTLQGWEPALPPFNVRHGSHLPNRVRGAGPVPAGLSQRG